MSVGKNLKWCRTAIAFVAVASVSGSACAQAPGGYGEYFQKKAVSAPYGGVASSSRYLYDKYFYHRPTVSPYMNVFRPDPEVGTSYQAYVRPEMQRREASATASRAYVQQRKLVGNVGETRYPGAGYVGGTARDAWMKPAPTTFSAPRVPTTGYYNHYYGGWNKR